MKYAILSDIHSNLEALETALAHIKKNKVDQIISLGDVVGYGANPSECLAIVKQNCEVTIMGNHDQAVEDFGLRSWFNEYAREAIKWTGEVLKPQEKKIIRTFDSIIVDKKNNITWTHGSIHEPQEYHYLLNDYQVAASFKRLETKIGFFGHTHIPELFSLKSDEGRYLPEGTYQFGKGDRYLINPGSLGQPRDHNPKLSFAYFDTDQLMLEIIRLDYDNHKTAAKIKKAGLPAYLAERLL